MGDRSSFVGNQLTLGYRLKRRLLLLPRHLVSPWIDGFLRPVDQARGLGEVPVCKINHSMYLLICMGQTINAQYT